VVLLDEIEKAHPEVFNVLLQLLDDGRLTDSQGRTVDFRNTIVLMTSNIGSDLLRESTSPEELERARELLLRDHFRPEFLNRLDGIVQFHALGREHVRGILEIHLERLQAKLDARELGLEVTDRAREALAERGYDAEFGARPLERLLRRVILDPLARGILEGRFPPGTRVVVDMENGDQVRVGTADGDAPHIVVRAA
jgi:ATP-dependent Clp protease ATP-binding subunit ClpB